MAYSPKQWRAIRLYSEKHNVVPQLSAFPNVRFMDRQGEVTVVDVINLELQYDAHKEQEKRIRAQERREAVKREKADKAAVARRK